MSLAASGKDGTPAAGSRYGPVWLVIPREGSSGSTHTQLVTIVL